jgi:spermidine/putrescine transport system ATP-binding protein
MEKKQPIIELKHIKKCYTKDVPVIYDFNLTINEGEFVTFLGPSGCGKTTILRMLAGFETPTSGEILFNGKDISELPPNERKFNTVFQKYALFPHLNIYDNISFGLKEKKVPKNEIKKKVKRVLEIVDLEGFEKRKIDSLSGGQQQRLCIARALAVKPEVLLMDEPTSALDPISTIKIEELAQELKKDYTIVMVTHNMQQATRISDKTVFFLLGEIIEAGKTDELFSMPKDKRTEDYITGRFG